MKIRTCVTRFIDGPIVAALFAGIVSLVFVAFAVSPAAWAQHHDFDYSFYDSGIGNYKPFFYNGELASELDGAQVQGDTPRGVLRFVPMAGTESELRAQYPLELLAEAGQWIHGEFFVSQDLGVGVGSLQLQISRDGKWVGALASGVRSRSDHEDGDWQRYEVHAQLNQPVDKVTLIFSLHWAEDAPQTDHGLVISDARIWVTEEGPDYGEALPEVQEWMDELRQYLEQQSVDFDAEKHAAAWHQLAVHAALASTSAELYAPAWPATSRFFAALDGRHSGIYSAQSFEALTTMDEEVAAADFGWNGEVLAGQIVRIEVPPFPAIDPKTMTAFAQAGHAILGAYRPRASCGWVIDLRENSGGNMWGMVLGLQPLLGEGEIGAFVNREGERQRWLLSASSAAIEEKEMSRSKPAGFALDVAPVAVLSGSGTMSSGEATTVSFRGRPNTRSFGADTRGFADSIEQFTLPDGAALLLATARYSDRTGRVYGRTIPVEEPSDEPLEAAVEWLMGMCEG